MKEGRRAGGITAGPESEVLKGGTSWEEAAEQVRAASAAGGGFGYGMADSDVGGYKVGAASKGIIQVSLQSLILPPCHVVFSARHNKLVCDSE